MDHIRPVHIVGVSALVAVAITFATSKPETKLQDGITFEEDGTAITGRESGQGWLDLKCGESGRVVVKVVNERGWQIVDQGSFANSACDNGELEPGELTMDDIPDSLKG